MNLPLFRGGRYYIGKVWRCICFLYLPKGKLDNLQFRWDGKIFGVVLLFSLLIFILTEKSYFYLSIAHVLHTYDMAS